MTQVTLVLGILLACCLVVIIILFLTRNKKHVCEHCKGKVHHTLIIVLVRLDIISGQVRDPPTGDGYHCLRNLVCGLLYFYRNLECFCYIFVLTWMHTYIYIYVCIHVKTKIPIFLFNDFCASLYSVECRESLKKRYYYYDVYSDVCLYIYIGYILYLNISNTIFKSLFQCKLLKKIKR